MSIDIKQVTYPGTLEKINDNYPKLVLSMDKFHDPSRAGIQWKNLIDYLTRT
jgi:hypothetical protein